MTATPARLVFLLDVDNTLLDNDAIIADMRTEITRLVGATRGELRWCPGERRSRPGRMLGQAQVLGRGRRVTLASRFDR